MKPLPTTPEGKQETGSGSLSPPDFAAGLNPSKESEPDPVSPPDASADNAARTRPPGTALPSGGAFGALLMQDGVPSFKMLFEQAVELGDAKLLPCSMAMDVLKIDEKDLDPFFGPPTGLTHFISLSEGGQILTF